MARRSRRRLTQIEYEALRREAQVLSKDEHGDKVLLTPQARIIKLFRRKRLFSSALFYPYANRFADAAVRLASLGIPCPQVEAVYRIPAIRRDAVVYPKLDGTELRRTIKPAQLRTLAHFLADLHAKGVYFRAAHFGNLLVLPDQS